MKRILIIDEDLSTCKELEQRLQNQTTRVHYALSAKEALTRFSKERYHLVIMELHLSEMDGMVLLETLRQADSMPILILSARCSTTDKVEALRKGADDYVVKPYITDELLARSQAHLRRYTQLYPNDQLAYTLVACRNLIINPTYRTVSLDGETVELTIKEFDMLYYFAINPNKVLRKEQIYSSVWKNEFDMDENAIRCHVNRLRAKLGLRLKNQEFLETVRGIGYRFIDS